MPKIIMLVDDEKNTREAVKRVLETNNYKVVTAVDGDDCLKKLKSGEAKPDLILMDILMPGTPVKQVVAKIKGVKIAYFTVLMTEEAEKRELMNFENVVGFIQKPFTMQELLDEVKTAISK